MKAWIQLQTKQALEKESTWAHKPARASLHSSVRFLIRPQDSMKDRVEGFLCQSFFLFLNFTPPSVKLFCFQTPLANMTPITIWLHVACRFAWPAMAHLSKTLRCLGGKALRPSLMLLSAAERTQFVIEPKKATINPPTVDKRCQVSQTLAQHRLFYEVLLSLLLDFLQQKKHY